MADDPLIQWVQPTRFGIRIDEPADAWHAGHVNDVIRT